MMKGKTLMSRIAVVAALVIVFGGSALAQNAGPMAPPGAHPARPCAADRTKYCKDVEPGHGKLIDCMEAHKAQLAPACRTLMEGRFKMRDQMRAKSPGNNMQTKPA